MIFLVRMNVTVPHDLGDDELAAIKADEKRRAVEIQQAGKWPHLWRVAGRYANVSIFDVDSVDELHDLISSLPMFRYMDIDVTPLARHPSSRTKETP